MSATVPAPPRAPSAATALRATSPSAMLLTLLAGCATTLLALVGVWAVSRYWGENVMGWYANYVLPVGALLVGLLASSVAEVGRSKARPGSRKGVWVHLRVVHCPGCGAGELRTDLAFRKGKQVKVTPLAVEALERGVAPRLLAALRGPRSWGPKGQRSVT